MTLRVLVVSDVQLLQEGVSSILALQNSVQVVGTTSVELVERRATELRPDVVLFDATRRESIEWVRYVVESAPSAKVVAFGVKETGDEILALAAAGAAGFVRDSTRGSDLAAVLERVMCDELLCSPRAAASLYRQIAVLSHAATAEAAAPLLSRRELQIAHLINRGLTNKQIARQLRIEPPTVKNHVHHICEKLGVHKRGEVAARVRANMRSLTQPLAAAPEQADAAQ